MFDDELIYVDTFDYAKYYNKMFIENGAMMHYDQGHYNANIAFDELSNYVRAKLMWDVSLDEQVLINDFICSKQRMSLAFQEGARWYLIFVYP